MTNEFPLTSQLSFLWKGLLEPNSLWLLQWARKDITAEERLGWSINRKRKCLDFPSAIKVLYNTIIYNCAIKPENCKLPICSSQPNTRRFSWWMASAWKKRARSGANLRFHFLWKTQAEPGSLRPSSWAAELGPVCTLKRTMAGRQKCFSRAEA